MKEKNNKKLANNLKKKMFYILYKIANKIFLAKFFIDFTTGVVLKHFLRFVVPPAVAEIIPLSW